MMYKGLHMDIFIRELKSMLNSIIVKRTVLAKKYETVDIMREAEMYVMVMDRIDDFSSYNNFDPSVYKRIGVPDEDMYVYLKDKNEIPYGLRNSLVKLQREFVVSNYEEKNNYYLMLNGKPDYGDTDFIYAPENSYGISTTIPVHQLTSAAIERLRSSGLLDKLKEENPDKGYLNYLGIYSIDIYTARKALNYELLYSATTDPDNIGLNFKKFYSNAREYYMNAIYNGNTAKQYEYYDNFIGLCILIMAIQRLFASVFEQGISRDFYDVQLVRYLFDSYSIPFIEDMTFEQMRLLAKNLNIFLSYKSSNKVIFDLCSIFGFSNVNVYKYLLVRDHVKDAVTGKPIFPTTTISNGDGTFSTVPDYELMYNIYFQKVNIRSKDLSAALVDKSNMIDYTQLTVGDIYWVDDEELKERLYTAGMNHIESKYLSMDILFKITEMMYEISHTFRMIIDNNAEFKKVSLWIPKVSSIPQDLYSIVIFLCAMFCKRYGFGGEIPLKPASIAYVYGFNFHTDLDLIINDIIESKYIDNDVVKYLINFQVNSNKDVDRIYKNIKAFKDFLTEQMASTKDIEVYRAYKALYNSVLVVEDKKEMYRKENGELASNYFELLESINPELYSYLENFDTTDSKNTEAIMEHVLYRMETLCTEYKYLHTAVDSSSLIRVLIRLINFFKSYTVDLTQCGILYLFDDRFFNMLKILDGIHSIEVNMDVKDGFLKMYYDAIKGVDIDFIQGEKIKMLEDVFEYINALLLDRLFLGDNLFASVLYPVETKLLGQYSDTMDLELKFADGEHFKFIAELAEYIIKAILDDRINLQEFLSKLIISDVKTELLSQYSDSILTEIKRSENEEIPLRDELSGIDNKFFIDEKIKIEEYLSESIISRLQTKLLDQYTDNISILTEMSLGGRILVMDKLIDKIVKRIIDEYIVLKENLSTIITSDVKTELLGQYSDSANFDVQISNDANMNINDKLADLIIRMIPEEDLELKEELYSEIFSTIQTKFLSQYSDVSNMEVSHFKEHRLIFKSIEDVLVKFSRDISLTIHDKLSAIIKSDVEEKYFGIIKDDILTKIFVSNSSILKFFSKLAMMEVAHNIHERILIIEKISPSILTKIQTHNIFNYNDDNKISTEFNRDIHSLVTWKLANHLVKFISNSSVFHKDCVSYNIRNSVDSELSVTGKLHSLIEITKTCKEILVDKLSEILIETISEKIIPKDEIISTSIVRSNKSTLIPLSVANKNIATLIESRIKISDEMKATYSY